MKKLILIFLIASLNGLSQLPYSWTNGIDPGWVSTNSGLGGGLDWNTACNSVTTNCFGNYSNYQNTSYTSSTINTECNNASTVSISFNVEGDAEWQFDFLFLEYSLDGGTTWINFYGPGIGLSGNAGAGALLSLPAIPTSSSFRFRFRFESDFVFTRVGYKITDFLILCNVQLPVELNAFEVKPDGTCVDIFWSTHSESNNDYFTVEKSVDGKNWENYCIVQGSGNSTVFNEYSCSDNLRQGVTYYRLTQYDFNGVSEELGIRSVKGKLNVTVVKTVNLIGQEVDESYRGVVIDIFTDNTTRKRYQ